MRDNTKLQVFLLVLWALQSLIFFSPYVQQNTNTIPDFVKLEYETETEFLHIDDDKPSLLSNADFDPLSIRTRTRTRIRTDLNDEWDDTALASTSRTESINDVSPITSMSSTPMPMPTTENHANHSHPTSSTNQHHVYQETSHTPLYAPPNEKVLGLLFPPGIHGGYRNQVIRLMGLVLHALQHDISYILLDSLSSVTTLPSEPYVLFEDLFDVNHWNTFGEHLPLLVNYHESSGYTCWKRGEGEDLEVEDLEVEDQEVDLNNSTTSTTKENIHARQVQQARQHVISKGFFTPVYNRSIALLSGQEDFNMHKLRHLDLRAEANTCQGNPIPYGGGTFMGELWKGYTRAVRSSEQKGGSFPFGVQEYILQALRPKKQWRDLSMSCISSSSSSSSSPSSSSSSTQNYVGLHMRMELDMMRHKCGRDMEHNSTRLFSHIDEFLSSLSSNSSATNEEDIDINTIVVATSRAGMEQQEEGGGYNKYKEFIDENLNTLNHFTKSNDSTIHTFGGRPVSVLECGRGLVDQYFENHPEENAFYYQYVLPMIVDFHILTEATIFIGVRKSSFSTDVWTTRYYQGKGKYNYEYTPEGIFPIENDGLPPPHKACK